MSCLLLASTLAPPSNVWLGPEVFGAFCLFKMAFLFFFLHFSIAFEQRGVQPCPRATGPNLRRISSGPHFIPGHLRDDGQQHTPKVSCREQNPRTAMNYCQTLFSMTVQEPSSPPHCLASPHDAAAATGSSRLKEVSKYNQPLTSPPTLPLQLSGKIPFCLKLSRCALQLEGSLWEKIRGSLDETFPEAWGWELVPLWSRPAPLTCLPLPELGLVRSDRFYPLMRTRE